MGINALGGQWGFELLTTRDKAWNLSCKGPAVLSWGTTTWCHCKAALGQPRTGSVPVPAPRLPLPQALPWGSIENCVLKYGWIKGRNGKPSKKDTAACGAGSAKEEKMV